MPVVMVVPVTMCVCVCVIIVVLMSMDVVVRNKIVGRFMVIVIMRVLNG